MHSAVVYYCERIWMPHARSSNRGRRGRSKLLQGSRCLDRPIRTLKPDEVYSLTAYLLAINKVIPEDMVLDRENLAKVKMPIGEEYGKPHEFKVNSPRLPGYPY